MAINNFTCYPSSAAIYAEYFTSMRFSDYVIFVDESGDPSISSIDPEFPFFVLVFCIFKKSDYFSQTLPRMGQFKFRYWGHDLVILHSHEIRKEQNQFSMLVNADYRNHFLNDLTDLIDSFCFHIVAEVINKYDFVRDSGYSNNPYSVALHLCLEKAYMFLHACGQGDGLTHVVVEKRGAKEDKELTTSFQQITHFPLQSFQLEFAGKQLNSSGLQVADLVAYPIARNAIKPLQTNRSFEVVRKKIWEPAGEIEASFFSSLKRKAPVFTEA